MVSYIDEKKSNGELYEVKVNEVCSKEDGDQKGLESNPSECGESTITSNHNINATMSSSELIVDSDDENESNSDVCEEDTDSDSKQTEEDNEDDSEESSSRSSEDSEDSENKPFANEDAEQSDNEKNLSAYERQRLERIQRNRAYLAQLGLEGHRNNRFPKSKHQQSKSNNKMKKSDIQFIPRRTTISRRTKAKPVSYTEPSLSVRDIFRESNTESAGSNEASSGRMPSAMTSTVYEEIRSIGSSKNTLVSKRCSSNVENMQFDLESVALLDAKKWKRKNAMDAFLYREYCHIKAHKNQVIKDSEKIARAAEKEVRIWKQIWNKWNLKVMKAARHVEQEQQNRIKEECKKEECKKEEDEIGTENIEALSEKIEVEKKLLGSSIAQLLDDIDTRMTEIVAATKEYDENLERISSENENRLKQIEAEYETKSIDALEKFKSSVKEAVSLFDTFLFVRAPKGISCSRRITRNSIEEQVDVQTPKRKILRSTSFTKRESTPKVGGWQECESSLQVINIPDPHDNDNATGKRRNRRFVGIWSPSPPAPYLDRSWLEMPNQSSEFNPSFYVPQCGDIVLYYMTGHWMYLNTYPDLFAKKLRQKARIPLWERAKSMRNENQETTDNSDSNQKRKIWWNDEWLDGVETGYMGCYPIVCRVERTHAEFPPYPVSTGHTATSDMAYHQHRNIQTGNGDMADPALTTLRLAVTLRPLSPVLPPVCDGDSIIPSNLSPPPVFCAIIFPSKLEPYLIPFTWAYARTHELSVNQAVITKNYGDTEFHIVNFARLGQHFGSFRLDDKLGHLHQIISRFERAPTKSNAMDIDFRNHKDVPFEKEAKIVLDIFFDVLRRNNYTSFENGSSGPPEVVLFDLVLSTLPIWGSVSITHNMMSQMYHVSPWSLVTRGMYASPWTFGRHSISLDNELRVKVERVVDDIIQAHEGSDVFFPPVDKDEVPDYFDIVPLGMCLSLIRQRLKPIVSNAYGQCYYRGIDSVLSDINMILDNCILYNNPDSDIVSCAADMVTLLTTKITAIVKDHNLLLQQSRNVNLEKRKLDLHHHNNCELNEQASFSDAVEKPFNEPLNRSWLEQTSQEDFNSRSNSSRIISNFGFSSIWLPQVGDKVAYSAALHARFVQWHRSSLAPNQCEIVPLPGTSFLQKETDLHHNDYTSINEISWHCGEIIWSRNVFPQEIGQNSGKGRLESFPSNSPLMVLGIKLEFFDELISVYWRPCVLLSDPVPHSNVCSICGLSYSSSFLQLQPRAESTRSNENDEIDQADDLDEFEENLGSIERCFSFLKQRCINGVTPSKIEHEIKKRGKKQMLIFSQSTFNPSPLPIFDHLWDEVPIAFDLSSATQDVILSLVSTGFLPMWINSSGEIDDTVYKLAQSMLPNTKLCLEFIHFRLRKRFYRCRKALENDLIDAYISTVFLIVGESARRNEAPISVKSIAKILETIDLNGASKKKRQRSSTMSDKENEEFSFVSRIIPVREVFAVAFSCVTSPESAEFIFGLKDMSGKLEPFPNVFQEHARQKLAVLLNALGPDLRPNPVASSGMQVEQQPTINLKILCNNKVFVYSQQCRIPMNSHTLAALDGKVSKVKLICNSEPFTKKTKVQKCLKPIENPKSPLSRYHTLKMNRISFNLSLCEDNPALARFLFGRTGRLNPCARCELNGCSMLFCRVSMGHSNPDFDWFSNFRGVGGVDGLLNTLRNPNVIDDRVANVRESDAIDRNAGACVNTLHQYQENLLDSRTYSTQHDLLDNAEHTTVLLSPILQQPDCLDEAITDFLDTMQDHLSSVELDHLHEQDGIAQIDLIESLVPTKSMLQVADEFASMSSLTTDHPNVKFSMEPTESKNEQVIAYQADDFSGNNSSTMNTTAIHLPTTLSSSTLDVQSKINILSESIGQPCKGEHVTDITEHANAPLDAPNSEYFRTLPTSQDQGNEYDCIPAQVVDSTGTKEDICLGEGTFNNTVDPSDSYELAKDTLVLAKELLDDANTYYKAPVRFSKDFISKFPVDDDGHYAYCILCGLIGNLLCCDGCPNVVHSACIGLKVVPEGEWFCEECVLMKKSSPISASVDSLNINCITSENKNRMPFGRNSFDDRRILAIADSIDRLRDQRGIMRLFLMTKKDKSDYIYSEHEQEIKNLKTFDNRSDAYREYRRKLDLDDRLDLQLGIQRKSFDSNFRERVNANHLEKRGLSRSRRRNDKNAVKRKRGRPRKYPIEIESQMSQEPSVSSQHGVKRPLIEENTTNNVNGSTPNIDSRKKLRPWEKKLNKKLLSSFPQINRVESRILSITETIDFVSYELKPRAYIHPAKTFDLDEHDEFDIQQVFNQRIQKEQQEIVEKLKQNKKKTKRYNKKK